MKRIAAFAATALVCLGIGVHSQTLPPPARPVANAAQIEYDNTTSGLSATQVQAALDEIKGTGGGASHIIKDTGTPLPTRAGLNFLGDVECLDDVGNSETDCTFTGGVGGGITELTADGAGGPTTGTSILLAGGTNGIDTSRSGDSIIFAFDPGEVGTDAFTDAQISNTLTSSIFIGVAGTNAVDLGTAEVAGLLTVAKGGTGAAPTGDDYIFVATGTATGAWSQLQTCTDGTHYLDWTGTGWQCTAITGGSGTALQSADTPVNDIRYDNTANLWYEDRATTGSFQPGEELEIGPSQDRKIVTATANLAGVAGTLEGLDIEAAITACGATGSCEVRLVAGTYTDVCLSITRSHTHFIGKGEGGSGTVWKPYVNLVDCETHRAGTADWGMMVLLHDVDDVEIAHIEMDGDKETVAFPGSGGSIGSAGCYVNVCGIAVSFSDPNDPSNGFTDGLWAHHLNIHDFVGGGLVGSPIRDSVIEDNTISGLGCDANRTCGCTGDPGTCRGWTAAAIVEGGTDNKSNANGVSFDEGDTTFYSARNVVRRNHISETTKIGVEIYSPTVCGAGDTNGCARQIQIVDNTFSNASLTVNGGSQWTLARNVISGMNAYGASADFGAAFLIAPNSAGDGLIENNIIHNNDGSGMVVKPLNIDNITIRGNQLWDNCQTTDSGGNMVLWSGSDGAPATEVARNMLVEGNTVVGSANCPYALYSGVGGGVAVKGSVIFRGGTYGTGSVGAVYIDNANVEVDGLEIDGNATFTANAHGIARGIDFISGTLTNTGGVCVLENDSTPIPASCVSGTSSAGGWGVASNIVSLSSTTDEVVIGGSTVLSGAKLTIDGDTADQILLNIQGHATQTTPLLLLENSIGTDVFSVDVNGQITTAALLDDGAQIILKEGTNDGTGSFALKVPNGGLTGDTDTVCEIGVDGKIPASCISGGSAYSFFADSDDGTAVDEIANGENLLISGGKGINSVSGTNTVFVNLAYDDTLASGLVVAKECVFTTEGTSGGGFICEGSAGSDTAEELFLFPPINLNDLSRYIVIGANVSTDEIASGEILVGTGVGTAAYVDFSGDADISTAGVVDLAADAVEPDELDTNNSPTDDLCLAYELTGDTMKWVSCGAAAGGWTDTTTNVSLTTTTDDVIIGGATPLNTGKVSIDGDADQVQFTIQGNATQTASSGQLMIIENSGGTDLFTVENDGDVVGGTFTSGATATPNLLLSDSTTSGDGRIIVSDAAGPDATMDLQVDIADTLTSFLQIDGINETVDILKPITLSTPLTDAQVDDIALGTGTSGNYVSAATASQGLTVSTPEGGTVGLIDCAPNEILQMDGAGTAWTCQADDTGAGGGDPVQVNGTGVDAAAGINLIDGAASGIDFTLNITADPEPLTPTVDLTELSTITLGTANFTTLIADTTGSNNPTLTFGDNSIAVSNTATWTFNGNTVLSGDANEGLSGGGLEDCDLPGDTLNWDSGTNKFSCGDDVGVDEVGTVTNTDICQGDGSSVQCTIATLANLNTALGSNIADGAHTADQVGAVTNANYCTGDGTLVQCSTASIPTTALATEIRSMYWGAGSMSADGTNCANPAEVTIGGAGGPKLYTIICTDNAASAIYGSTVMPDSWTDASTVEFELTYIQTAANTADFNSTIAAQCRGNGEAVSTTWGTPVAISDAGVTGSNQNDQASATSVTPAGTCAGGDVLYWRWLWNVDSDTAAATLNIVGLKMEFSSNVGD